MSLHNLPLVTQGFRDCAAGGQCSLVSQQLWLLLLQLQASESSQELAMQAATASQRLAAACGQSSSADLAAMHAPSLISAVAQVCQQSVYCLLPHSLALCLQKWPASELLALIQMLRYLIVMMRLQ